MTFLLASRLRFLGGWHLFAGLGVLLTAGSLFAHFYWDRPNVGGRLEATRPNIVWSAWDKRAPVSGSEDAVVTFEVVNRGGAAVRIESVESSCGCATPTVRPTLIWPGQMGAIEVKTKAPPVGERVVTVSLRTDSPVTPDVQLRLTVVGSRRPPFLYGVEGDLNYIVRSSLYTADPVVAPVLVLAEAQ